MISKLAFAVITLLITSVSFAQENRSELSLQGTGVFIRPVAGDGRSYSATRTAGFQGAYRFRLFHGLAVEAAYGYNHNIQTMISSSGTLLIPSDNHQLTAALVEGLPTLRKMRLSPYLLVGGGTLISKPMASDSYPLSAASPQSRPAFVYGGGSDYALSKGISLRLEYRGLVYLAPDMGFSSVSTGIVTHSAQPSAGLSFRF